MKSLLLIGAFAVFATAALAQSKLDYVPDDSVKTVLQRLTGQRIELHLRSGQKLAGKIEKLGPQTVHLSAISGQEFFDAVVVLEDVSAVLVRTK